MTDSPNKNPPPKTAALLKARTAQTVMDRLAPPQMAVWSEQSRAIANELTRSSLFSCRDVRSPRDYYKDKALFVLSKGTTVTYTGEELRARDEDIWLAIVHASRDLPLDNLVIKITNSEICKLNDWPSKQPYYTEIYKSIQRLVATNLTVHSRRLAKARACEEARLAGASDEELTRLYDELAAFDRNEVPDDGKVATLMLSMIQSASSDGEKGEIDNIPQGNLKWTLTLDKAMVVLFARPYLTLIPQEARAKLSFGARRLLAYYLGHADPNDVKISSLVKLLNLDYELSEQEQQKAQRRMVLERLNELVSKGMLLSAVPAEGRGDVTVAVVRAQKIGMANDSPCMANDSPLPE